MDLVSKLICIKLGALMKREGKVTVIYRASRGIEKAIALAIAKE
jgi:hypothetical protein